MSDGFIIKRGGSGGDSDFKALVDRSITNVTAEMLQGVTSIGEYAFYYCRSLTSITIPNSVTSIEGSAFSYCSSLASIEIPNSVTSIGASAFSYCSSLTSVTIPNGVTSIGRSAFQSCSSLTSVTIPNSLTIIGYYTFDSCTSLTSVTVKATTPPTLLIDDYTLEDPFCRCNQLDAFYVPAESVDAYKAASGWSTYASKIQAIPSD